MSRGNNIINALFKDWLYGYAWIPDFWQTRDGNVDSLRAWMVKQSSEKAYLGLRSSLVAILSTMHFYVKGSDDSNGGITFSNLKLTDLPIPDASIKPDWESLRQYNITTVGDLLPYMIPAIHFLDGMWANKLPYHAINNRRLTKLPE